ncbi:MAG: hypothetical protein ABI618_06645, partial [Nitrospirota bacterium]
MDKRIPAMRISLFGVALFFIVGMGTVLASNGGSLNEPNPVSGHSITLEDITPADVLARVQLFGDTLELIRFEMGKPLVTPSDAIATDIHSHEAYFQALTLFHKADRLALELTGSTGIP